MNTLVFSAIVLASSVLAPAHTFEVSAERDAFLLDGEPLQIRCGEMHFARVPRPYWRQRLKMCKAMGLNTVCAYLFWNYHQPERGQFDFSDNRDVAEFCRVAQEEGLWVILRPGPYACAEWEFGGFPWWLLDQGADKVKIRTSDPAFMGPVKIYLTKVAEELKDLQVTRGGPILMVQDENEYGFFGNDGEYIRSIYQVLRDAGFEVPIFTCNPAYHLTKGVIPETAKVVNFGTNPKNAFAKLREVQPRGPLMCGEYYPAWYDTWGQRHHTKPVQKMIDDIDYMLSVGGSFSLYMAHGGTSFDVWAGQNSPFAPITSSYDYEAPIDEQGRATPKFHALRELLKKYMTPAELAQLPAIPEPVPVQALQSDASAEIGAPRIPRPANRELMDEPLPVEMLGLGYGAMVYATKLEGKGGLLKAPNLRDQAAVFADGKHVGFLSRRFANRGVKIPSGTQMLSIVVCNMGRYHFGTAMKHAEKGLLPPVTLEGKPLKGWNAYPAPATKKFLSSIVYSQSLKNEPCLFKRFKVRFDSTADTWLLVRGWQKGFVWVNGYGLGRFWGVGPTQTMYVPGCWLKPGENEFVVFDFAGNVPMDGLTFVDAPVLDEMHPDCDFIVAAERESQPFEPPQKPTLKGEFPNSADARDVRLDRPRKARRFAFVMDSDWANKDVAALAEFEIINAKGESVPHDTWDFVSVSSEESLAEDGAAENAIDGQISNFYHSRWSKDTAKPPHYLVIDMGAEVEVAGFRYTPRQDSVSGRIRAWRFYLDP